MDESTTAIAVGWRFWKYLARVRQVFQEVEKYGDAILHVTDLQKRVADLEKRLERCPGEACPKCGELTYRVEKSEPVTGHVLGGDILRSMKCERCGYTEPPRRITQQWLHQEEIARLKR